MGLSARLQFDSLDDGSRGTAQRLLAPSVKLQAYGANLARLGAHAYHGNITHPNEIFVLIAQQTVGNRPGRIEPRAIKRRQKAYPLLTQPRSVARDNVRKNGHPKKLK